MSTDDPKQLFREDTIYTILAQQYIRGSGAEWLFEQLSYPFKTICTSKSSAEISTMKIESAKKRNKNTKTLLKMTTPILENIFMSFHCFPAEIIRTCKYIFETCCERFEDTGYHALSSFLFLRFICPCISSPEYHKSFTRKNVSIETQRNLILVTKLVQRIATFNLEFTDEHNKLYQDFVCKNIQRMKRFYDDIINVRFCSLI